METTLAASLEKRNSSAPDQFPTGTALPLALVLRVLVRAVDAAIAGKRKPC